MKREYLRLQLHRVRALVHDGAASLTQLQQAESTLAETDAAVQILTEQLAGLLASIGGDPGKPVDDYPSVHVAKQRMQAAAYNLAFATVVAPFDGTVANIENIQLGTYVVASKPLFSLFSDSDIVVEANFKEDQLHYISVGDSADVELDRIPHKLYHASVVSTGPATGASLSVLPPENATGNWVKVPQRVPLLLRFTTQPARALLADGLSVTVSIPASH